MFDPDQPPKSNVKNRPTYHCIPNPCSLFWSTWYCLPFIFNCISLNLASYLMIANLRLVLKSWGLLENQFLVLGSLAAAAAAGCQWMRRRPSRCCPAIFHRRYSATTRPSYNSKHYNSFLADLGPLWTACPAWWSRPRPVRLSSTTRWRRRWNRGKVKMLSSVTLNCQVTMFVMNSGINC